MGLCSSHVWYRQVGVPRDDTPKWIRAFLATALSGAARAEITPWQPFVSEQEHRANRHLLFLFLENGASLAKEYLPLCHALALHNAGRLLVIPVSGGDISAGIADTKLRALSGQLQSLPGVFVGTGPESIPLAVLSVVREAAAQPESPPVPAAGRPVVDVFSSYAHEDEKLREELDKQLKALTRSGLIRSWNDRQIAAGSEWERVLNQNLHTADIILLLLSPDFLASDYCYDIELPIAFERHKKDSARAVPVILRPVAWQTTELARLQALPKDAEPVTLWPSRDAALLNVCEGLLKLVVGWKSAASTLAPEKPAAPQSALRRRSLDAALPARVTRGKSVVLACMIRKTSSSGLRALVEANATFGIQPSEVQSSSVQLRFPINPSTGKPDGLGLQVTVESPDFTPPQQTRELRVPPNGDSDPCIFLLSAEKTGSLKVIVTICAGSERVASCLMGTTAVTEDQPPAPAEANIVSTEFETSPSTADLERERALAMENAVADATKLMRQDRYAEAHAVLQDAKSDHPANPQLEAALAKLREELEKTTPRSIPTAPAPASVAEPAPAPARAPVFRPLVLGTALAAMLMLGVTTVYLRQSSKRAPDERPAIKSQTSPITITTEPRGAEIRIDGKVVGTAPLQLTLPPGSYKVDATLPEYLPQTKMVQVFGQKPAIQLNLQPAKK